MMTLHQTHDQCMDAMTIIDREQELGILPGPLADAWIAAVSFICAELQDLADSVDLVGVGLARIEFGSVHGMDGNAPA